jgi:hypothetical protein
MQSSASASKDDMRVSISLFAEDQNRKKWRFIDYPIVWLLSRWERRMSIGRTRWYQRHCMLLHGRSVQQWLKVRISTMAHLDRRDLPDHALLVTTSFLSSDIQFHSFITFSIKHEIKASRDFILVHIYIRQEPSHRSVSHQRLEKE